MRRTRGSADWAALGFDVWLFGLEMAQVIWLRSWLIALGGVYIARAGVAMFAPWPGSRVPRAAPMATTMLGSAVALALAAVVMGWLVATPIERVLSLPSNAATTWLAAKW